MSNQAAFDSSKVIEYTDECEKAVSFRHLRGARRSGQAGDRPAAPRRGGAALRALRRGPLEVHDVPPLQGAHRSGDRQEARVRKDPPSLGEEVRARGPLAGASRPDQEDALARGWRFGLASASA